MNAGRACARLSRFPEAWRFDFEVRTAGAVVLAQSGAVVRLSDFPPTGWFGSERRRGAPLWFPSPLCGG